MGFGSNGEADFAAAVRLARNLGEDQFIGLEYYAGIRPLLKAILGYAFSAPNNGGQDNSLPSSLEMGTPSRPLQNAWNLNSVN